MHTFGLTESIKKGKISKLKGYINAKSIKWVGITVLLVLLLNTFPLGWLLQTNLLSGGQLKFDGTVVPFCKGIVSPKELYGQYRGMSWDQIPDSAKVPQLKYDYNALRAGTADSESLRLYSVPYMASYASPMQDGSHLADDIIQPVGTPICAIANGQVVKSIERNDGCGSTVVLRHDDVEGETYYSNYCHNSKNAVKEGDVVKKGDIIAYVGNTGISTTAHLHFQLDKSGAPFHPYWPFTYADAEKAGLNYFEAVDAGLNRNLAIQHTANPMEFVQKWLGKAPEVVPSSELAEETGQDEIDLFADELADLAPVEVDGESEDGGVGNEEKFDYEGKAALVPLETDFAALKLEIPTTLVVGQEYELTIKVAGNANNEDLTKDLKLYFDGASVDFPDDKKIESDDFEQNMAKIPFVVKEAGRLRFAVKNDDVAAYSKIGSASLFSDVSFSDPNYLVYEKLYNDGIVTGYSDRSLKPMQAVSRVEAVKLALVGFSVSMDEANFGHIAYKDIDLGSWYQDYLKVACAKNVACGDSNGNFRPTDEINLPELLKMLFKAANFDAEKIVGESKSAYKDVVEVDQWYADYVISALALGIIDQEYLIDIKRPLQRAEVITILAKARESL